MNGVEHLSREQIILLLEGELAAEETRLAEQHLEGCAMCREHLLETEKTFAAVSQALHASASQEQDPSREQLQKRMVHHHRMGRLRAGMAAAAAVVLVAGGITTSWVRHHAAVRPYLVDRPVPNPALTPGAVRTISFQDLCASTDDDLDPVVPAAVQQVVFAEYHVPQQQRGREFQVDYLINPQLGGTAEVRNLWPQPYATVWNAQVKDVLERRLHAKVCRGQLTLAEAQQELSGDWITSYQREFKTQTPLRVEAGLDEMELP